MDQPSTEAFDLEAYLSNIERVSTDLQKIPHAYLGPQGTKLPDIGWYVLAAIKKTNSLSHAFCTLVRAKNSLAATALIRLQIDTALRIFGLSLVADLDVAGEHLMNDRSYRKLKSRDGKPLDDAMLHRKLDEYYRGLSGVYERTSAYVHLTAAHIKTVLSKRADTRILFFNLNGVEETPDDEWFIDMVDAFDQATRLAAEVIEDFMRYRYAPAYNVCRIEKISADTGADFTA
nr:hypothetical protein [uncultured Devosia sp.]